MIKLNKVLATSLATLTLAGSSSQVFATRSKGPQKSSTSSATNATKPTRRTEQTRQTEQTRLIRLAEQTRQTRQRRQRRQRRINLPFCDHELSEFAYRVINYPTKKEATGNFMNAAVLVRWQLSGGDIYQEVTGWPGLGDETPRYTHEQLIYIFTLYFLNCKVRKILGQNEGFQASCITYEFLFKYRKFLLNSQNNNNIPSELREFAEKMVDFIVGFREHDDSNEEIYREKIRKLTNDINVNLHIERLLYFQD